MSAPKPARLLGWRVAYRMARDTDKRGHAALRIGELAGARELYQLVKRAGAGSPEESALFDCLFNQAGIAQFEPARYGFSNIQMDWEPPGENEPEDAAKVLLRYEFGSYVVTYPADWSKLSEIGEKPKWRMGCVLLREVERLPGPWRELPPAPPPKPIDYDDYAPL
jgi:hypothetical protein